MRKRASENGLTVTAVAGTSAVILSFDMNQNDTDGLLGFAIQREDHKENEKYYLKGFKYFKETVENRVDGQLFSTFEHPIQSFLWEDFTVKANYDYTYTVTPVFGKPKNLEYRKGCSIKIKTPSDKVGNHSVFFNRGVAGSLAYARKFKNKRPGENMSEKETKAALKWLSRGLEEALIEFIQSAKDSTYELKAAVYEFEYLPVLEAFKDAYEDRKVDVKIIYDARGERDANNHAINEVGLEPSILFPRDSETEKGYLSHNKFIILQKDNKPIAVWTGSTNITQKGIFGQCNVGHIIRDKNVVKQYNTYWEELKKDPLREDIRKETINIQRDLKANEIPNGNTVIFSPRTNKSILETYADCMKASNSLICGMFPFSFSKKMKEVITSDTNNLKYIIIDKKDKNTTLVTNDYDNVIVYGTYLKDGLYDWLEETHAGMLLNKKPGHIGTNFIHNKVLLIDPLSDNPIVITGSANFSDNSIDRNDENTLIIKGDKDVSDLYFTEFVRIFNHYYARQTALKYASNTVNDNENPIHLKKDFKKWVPQFYNPNGLKCKRKMMFNNIII